MVNARPGSGPDLPARPQDPEPRERMLYVVHPLDRSPQQMTSRDQRRFTQCDEEDASNLKELLE
jgi:hypothetical protein